MEPSKLLIVACIPAKDEEKMVAKVIVKVQKYVDKVIVLDDGSSDMTGEIAGRLGAEVIRHDKNLGYGAALNSLFKKAIEMGSDVVVTLDSDDQHDPDLIDRLVKPIVDGEADVVVGSRFLDGNGSQKSVPLYRKVGIEAITKLINATSLKDLTDAQSGMRAYSGYALKMVVPSEMGMGASAEILMKAKDASLRVAEVPIDINYNVQRASTSNPVKHGLDVVLSIVKYMSMKHPLIFYAIPGFFAMVNAMFFSVWTLTIFSHTGAVETNVALVAIGSAIVGLLLITTSILLWVLISVVREGGITHFNGKGKVPAK